MALAVDDPVGRALEFEQLGRILDAVEVGDASCLAVEGDAGIGKTHLLDRLRADAERRGHLVLSGSASEFELDLPFGVWVEALDAYVATLDVTRAGVQDVQALAGVLPALRESAAPAPGDERHRAQRAVRDLLAVIARTRPVVLVLDDLHWSDEASIDLIAAVLRRPPAAPVLLALGYRSGKIPERLELTLTGAGVTVIELGPLTAEESATLAGPEMSSAQAAIIYAESEGNPFYTLQMARAATAPRRSTTADRMAAGTGVPRLVAAAIVDELRGIPAPARALLEAAAVAGDPFDLDLARAITEWPPEDVLPRLDELLDARLVRMTEVPRRFRFRHPLMRRAVYEATPVGWRLGAHARAAQALTAIASPAVVAHHIEQSAEPGDAHAVALLREAGEVSAPHDPAGAARWFTAALRLTAADDGRGRLDTLIRLAHVLRATGDLEGSAARLLEALEEAPVGDVGLRMRLTSAYANCQHFLGRHRRAEAQVNAASDTFAPPGTPEAVAVLIDLTMGAFFVLDDDEMCRLAHRALAEAKTVGAVPLIVATTCALAHVTSFAGRTDEAAVANDAAAALIDALPDAELVEYADPLNRLTYGELLAGRFGDATRHGELGVDIGRRTGGIAFAPLTLAAQSVSLTMSGDYGAAVEHLDEALEIAEVTANEYVTGSVLSTGSFGTLMRGDTERALRLAERGVQLVGDMRGSRIALMVRFNLAIARRVTGATAAETAHLVEEAGGWALTGVTPFNRAAAHELIARAEIEAGRVDEAETAAAEAERTAASARLPIVTLFAERARARVSLAQGDGAAAVGLSAGADGIDTPVEAERSRVVMARALIDTDRARAVELLRAAEAVFDACGAERDRGEARRELRRLGVRVEPRRRSETPADGVGSLSGREREVADMVVDRKTNREIAAALFLSEKTVETHLRNIFAKLGTASRVEVARAVESAQTVG